MINGSISSSVHSQTIVTPWKDWTDRGSKTALSPLQDTLRPWHALEGLDRKRKQNCVKWLYLFLRTLSDQCHLLEGLDRPRKQNSSISSSGHSQTIVTLGRTGQTKEAKRLYLLFRTLSDHGMHWKDWTENGRKLHMALSPPQDTQECTKRTA